MDTSQQQHAANVVGRQLKKQSNSDEAGPSANRGKASSTTRPTPGTTTVANHTAQKRQLTEG